MYVSVCIVCVSRKLARHAVATPLIAQLLFLSYLNDQLLVLLDFNSFGMSCDLDLFI